MDNTTDPFPLVSPLNYPHSFVKPSLVPPPAGEFLSGLAEIQWTPSNITSNQSVTYTLYYSSDSGMTWKLLVSDLNGTSYLWDTTLVVDGTNYKLRVVAICSLEIFFEDISKMRFTIFNSFSPPFIIFPRSGAILMGTVVIEWSSSIFLSCTYSVSYSDDNGSSWTILFSGLTSDICVWDTTSVPDGFNYRIKVEAIYPNELKAVAISAGTFSIQNLPSLITTIMLPISVAIASLGMLLWINKRVIGIIEEKMPQNNEKRSV
jgi:hypothetical protein